MYIDVKYGKKQRKKTISKTRSAILIQEIRSNVQNCHYSVQGHICSLTSLGKIVLINWVPFTFYIHIKHLVFFYLECQFPARTTIFWCFCEIHCRLLIFSFLGGLFRTQSNICNGAFLRKQLTAFNRYLSSQKAPSEMFNWVLNTPLILVLLTYPQSTFPLYYLRKNKKTDMF